MKYIDPVLKESLSTTMHCALAFVYTYGNCAIKYDNYSRDMISNFAASLPAIIVLLESLRK